MNDPFASEWDRQDDTDEVSSNLLGLLPVILWERKLLIIIPLVIGLIAAIAAALFIPPVYRANAVMLVASSQLPDEILALDGSELIDRRMARIEEQVTSRPNLIALIERHGLYTDERQSSSLSEVVETMRESISLVPTRAGTRTDDDVIAFELAFEYDEPVAAQTTTQDLLERVLALDSSGNVEQVTNTVDFLEEQSLQLQTQIAELQQRIGQLTAANGGALSGGGFISGSTASYDVQIAGLRRENQQLTTQRTLALSSNERDPVVIGAETQLAGARAVYAENHPDVVIAKQRLVEAKELAKANTTRIPIEQIDEQIRFNNQQIAALASAQASEEASIRQRATA
ncbi:MAG: Wzz/FepE/Etk N-terminal domain-containing protein, partial [Erythrobacter sp.]